MSLFDQLGLRVSGGNQNTHLQKTTAHTRPWNRSLDRSEAAGMDLSDMPCLDWCSQYTCAKLRRHSGHLFSFLPGLGLPASPGAVLPSYLVTNDFSSVF